MAKPINIVPLYVVVCGHHEPYIAERNVEDASWGGTVNDIASGQFETLTAVFEICTGRNVTDIMLREALDLRSHRGADYSHKMFELAELHLGTRTARAMVR